MYKRLPPLNSLKSFESAARHLSFTKAADELFVTQAAVSHQIKSVSYTHLIPFANCFFSKLRQIL